MGGTWRLARLKGENPLKLPSQCISCGACTRMCPQSIKVYDYLKNTNNQKSPITLPRNRLDFSSVKWYHFHTWRDVRAV